jgi:hypothetical protein
VTINTCSRPLLIANNTGSPQPSGGLAILEQELADPAGGIVGPGQHVIIPIVLAGSPITVPSWIAQSVEYLYYCSDAEMGGNTFQPEPIIT